MPIQFPVEIDKLPQVPKRDSHYWADFIELLCLMNLDGEISSDNVIDRMETVVNTQKDNKGDQDAAITDDAKRQQVSDWFKHIEYRSNAFREKYPFAFSSNEGDYNLILKEKLSKNQKLYAFLLAASNLRYFKKIHINQITAIFEELSAIALKSYLPKTAKVHIFGKNQLNQGKYSGKLIYKIDKLTKDLNENTRVDEDTFSPHNTGDHGLDIVGWIPLDKNTPGFLLMFGQCACTPDWVNKQNDTKFDKWSKVMSFTAYPNNMVFIPYCFRNEFGDWHNDTDIQMSIVIDRLRLSHLLSKMGIQLDKILSHPFIDSFLDQHETLF